MLYFDDSVYLRTKIIQDTKKKKMISLASDTDENGPIVSVNVCIGIVFSNRARYKN